MASGSVVVGGGVCLSCMRGFLAGRDAYPGWHVMVSVAEVAIADMSPRQPTGLVEARSLHPRSPPPPPEEPEPNEYGEPVTVVPTVRSQARGDCASYARVRITLPVGSRGGRPRIRWP